MAFIYGYVFAEYIAKKDMIYMYLYIGTKPRPQFAHVCT